MVGGTVMKKFFAAIILFAGLVSCDRVSQPVPQEGMKTVTIDVASPVLKGSLDKDRYYSWSAGDRILVEVINGSSTIMVPFQTAEGGASAQFTGSIPTEASIGNTAYYPADAVTVSGDKVTFEIASSYDSSDGSFRIPLVGTRWGKEPFAFTAAAGAIKVAYNNVDASFGNTGTVVFQATEATNGSYALDKESGKLIWDGSAYSSKGQFSDGSKISVNVSVTAGRSVFAYIPLPENSNWGDIHISLLDASGKEFQSNDVPSGTKVPVEAGRITRLPDIDFPAEIYFALDPTDNDFSIWSSVDNLMADISLYEPWTWRGSWAAEEVYLREDKNVPCKQVKFRSDEKFLYGYVYVNRDLRKYNDPDTRMDVNVMLKNFYIFIDNDDISSGQSFGSNNIAEVPRYKGYNVVLYGSACTNGTPGVWKPDLYNCTEADGAAVTNIRGTKNEDIRDAGYGGGSVDGDIFQWEFVIDKAKTGLLGKSHTNVCISFCDSPSSNNTMMPSTHGFEIDL